jgi:hypothetical protein
MNLKTSKNKNKQSMKTRIIKKQLKLSILLIILLIC